MKRYCAAEALSLQDGLLPLAQARDSRATACMTRIVLSELMMTIPEALEACCWAARRCDGCFKGLVTDSRVHKR